MSSSSNSSSNSSSSPRVLEWELGLPSDEELTPISQTLIPPSLASAFSIPPISMPVGHGSTAASSARWRGKRPRVSWTPQLHRRFVEVVSRLGMKNAAPKTIMDMMNVEGLTRENVASHLQKYRLYLKRVGVESNLDPDADPDPNTNTGMPGLGSYNGT